MFTYETRFSILEIIVPRLENQIPLQLLVLYLQKLSYLFFIGNNFTIVDDNYTITNGLNLCMMC
jgi:hypothetical protein